MEQPHPDGALEREVPQEPKAQHHSAAELCHSRNQDHLPQQLHHTPDIRQAEGLLQDHPLLEAQLGVEHQKKQRKNRHEAQAAHLDQQQQDHLAEAGPLGEGIHQGQACDAGG